ncbi:hypothetical protein OESDEN_13615 [Oesophagostomum dentatum]|uniref:Uncharacterized protein n=1 Tax=Oesophagostomum dentatum TaxID=61180 RepID=A0A0B1STZ4_OESDE|nr:hypothetical protein OESDEN_13615 [Oesophagostomum dentatum]
MFAERFSDKGYSRSEEKLGEKISNMKRDLRYIVKVKAIPKHLLPILAAEIEELMEGSE